MSFGNLHSNHIGSIIAPICRHALAQSQVYTDVPGTDLCYPVPGINSGTHGNVGSILGLFLWVVAATHRSAPEDATVNSE